MSNASASRRSCLASLASAAVLPGVWLGLSSPAHASGQLEEPLMDSVRTALSSAIANEAPPEPEFPSTEARLLYLRWLATMSDRLRKRKPEWEVRRDFLQTAWYESRRAGLDVSLVLGLIQVESAFRKFAISSVGARGYMQIMPFWTRVQAVPHADQFALWLCDLAPLPGPRARRPLHDAGPLQRQPGPSALSQCRVFGAAQLAF